MGKEVRGYIDMGICVYVRWLRVLSYARLYTPTFPSVTSILSGRGLPGERASPTGPVEVTVTCIQRVSLRRFKFQSGAAGCIPKDRKETRDLQKSLATGQCLGVENVEAIAKELWKAGVLPCVAGSA